MAFYDEKRAAIERNRPYVPKFGFGIESDEIEIKADMDMTNLRIKQLNKLIIAQEKKVKKK